jgi:glycosyltransferase involved in cell wall biosynthesis
VSPLVSVIIPTRHRPQLLQRAIDSVNRQVYRNIEIIVFDNCSDRPIQPESLKSQLPVKLVRSETFERLPVSRNRALAAASGTYVAYLDDDDEYTPFKIGDQVAAFKENPNADMIYGNTEHRSANGSTIVSSGPPNIADYLRYRYIHPNSFTIKRDLAENMPFDIRMTTFEDVMFIGRILRQHRVVHIDRLHAIWYRDKRADQMTNRNWRRAYENWKLLCEEFRPELIQTPELKNFYFKKMLILSLMFFDFRELSLSLTTLLSGSRGSAKH